MTITAEISRIDAQLTSLADIHDDILRQRRLRPTPITSLNLHSNRIPRIDVETLRSLPFLTYLDLSSNYIERIEGLDHLSNLQSLNLSNNKIRRIENLQGLFALRHLYISYNQIKTLNGVVDLHGSTYNLRLLDLKGNAIDDIRELSYLAGLTKLKHLVLHSSLVSSSVRKNPLCSDQDAASYRASVFQMVPHIVSLDGADERGFIVEVEDEVEAELEYNQYNQYHHHQDEEGVGAVKDSHQQQHQENHQSNSNQVDTILNDRISEMETHLMRLIRRGFEQQSQQTQQKPKTPVPASLPLHSQSHHQPTLPPSQPAPPAPPQSIPTQYNPWESKLDGLEHKLAQVLSAISNNNNNSNSNSNNTSAPTTNNSKKEKNPSSASRLELLEEQMSELMSVLMDRPADASSDDDESEEVEVAVAVAAPVKKSTTKPVVTKKSLTGKKSQSQSQQQLQQPKQPSQPSQQHQQTINLLAKLEEEETRLKQREATLVAESERLQAHLQKQEAQHLADLQALEKSIISKDEIINEMKSKLERIVDVHSRLKSEHEVVLSKQTELTKSLDKVRSESSSKISSLETELLKYKDQAEHSQSQLQSERTKTQDLSLKLENCSREMDRLQMVVGQLQADKMALMSNQDSVFRSKLQELQMNHTNELNHVATETSQRLSAQHARELSSLKKSLNSAREAYTALETEFRNSIKTERMKYEELQSAYQTVSNKISEQKNMMGMVSQREKEMAMTIRELTSVVKEQKAKIVQLQDTHDAYSAVYEEKIDALEEKLKVAEQWKSDVRVSQKEVETLHSELTSKSAKISELTQDRQKFLDELTTQAKEWAKERSGLEAKVILLEQDKKQIVTKIENAENALRVKNKMLDDQNETIKTLKQNLDAKIKEHQSHTSDSSKRVVQLEEQLGSEIRANKELTRELESRDKFLEHLEVTVDELKREKEGLKSEISDLSRKLKERNDSIEKIELEVSKVNDLFRSKEAKIVAEKDGEIRSKEIVISELKRVMEGNSTKVYEYEREREGMLAKIAQYEKTMKDLLEEKGVMEQEMKILLVEMEKKKKKMDQKLAKLKAVFID